MPYNDQYSTVLDYIEAKEGTGVKYVVFALIVVSVIIGFILGISFGIGIML